MARHSHLEPMTCPDDDEDLVCPMCNKVFDFGKDEFDVCSDCAKERIANEEMLAELEEGIACLVCGSQVDADLTCPRCEGDVCSVCGWFLDEEDWFCEQCDESSERAPRPPPRVPETAEDTQRAIRLLRRIEMGLKLSDKKHRALVDLVGNYPYDRPNMDSRARAVEWKDQLKIRAKELRKG